MAICRRCHACLFEGEGTTEIMKLYTEYSELPQLRQLFSHLPHPLFPPLSDH